jgi:hypothetical protein
MDRRRVHPCIAASCVANKCAGGYDPVDEIRPGYVQVPNRFLLTGRLLKACDLRPASETATYSERDRASGCPCRINTGPPATAACSAPYDVITHRLATATERPTHGGRPAGRIAWKSCVRVAAATACDVTLPLHSIGDFQTKEGMGTIEISRPTHTIHLHPYKFPGRRRLLVT